MSRRIPSKANLFLMTVLLALFGLAGCASSANRGSCCAPGAKPAGHHSHGHKHGDNHDHSDGHKHGDDHDHSDGHKHEGKHGKDEHSDKGHACGACKTGRAGGTAWCDSCNVGYVNGKAVKCKSCFKGKSEKKMACSKCDMGFVANNGVKCKACSTAETTGEPCAFCKEVD